MRFTSLMLSALLLVAGCAQAPTAQPGAATGRGQLAGAWRSKITFSSGPLAGMKDLEFLYAYNQGGTMTESSNYDEAANSSPPAYGVWRQVDPQTFETKYLFYTTTAPGPGDAAANGHDWWPSGHGVLTETIKLAADGKTYASTIKLNSFDKSDTPVAGAGEGIGAGTRIEF